MPKFWPTLWIAQKEAQVGDRGHNSGAAISKNKCGREYVINNKAMVGRKLSYTTTKGYASVPTTVARP